MDRPTTDIDLLSPELQRDPYPPLAELRRTAPVVWSERHRGWLLTRYDDVAFAFRDARLSADRMTPTFARLAPEVRAEMAVAERHLTRWLVFLDPPDHDRLRRLVSRAFTPPRMEEMRRTVRVLVDDLLDDWAGAGADGEVDVHRTLAHPLPTNVVAAVLGVPPDDYLRVAKWSADVAAVVFGTGSDPSRFVRAQRGLEEFDAYIREIASQIREGRGQPGLVADLVALRDGTDRLDDDELVATCTLLLFAGDETTTVLIGNAFTVLSEAPEERAQLAADPESMAGPAVEELLRFAGPTKAMVRHTKAEVDLPSGATLPAGERVYTLVAAANRDPARFEDPDAFDVDRRDNLHLGFGSGIHHCLGAPLARIEVQEVLRAVSARFPDSSLTATPGWGGGLLGRAAGRVVLRPGRQATAGRARP